MRVAVTGAGGHLGAAVVQRLKTAGHDVIALSSTLSPTVGGTVRAWRAEQAWEDMTMALDGLGAVIHAAAHVPRDQRNPDEARACLDVNALGTLSLLRASERVGVQRFIFVSSANVLKARARALNEDDAFGCEHAPYYLGSKVMAEIFVRSFQARGMNPLIIRPSSIYGPNMRAGVLNGFVERLRAGMSIVLLDGGRFQADFVWGDDVASIIVKAVESKRSGVVNVGSGEARSLLDVAQMMRKILDADSGLIKVEPTDDDIRIVGFSAVNIKKAQRWFDFRPLPLVDGLRRWLGPAK